MKISHEEMLEKANTITKDLDGLDAASALSIINYAFVLIVLALSNKPTESAALVASLARNALNSIHDYYEDEDNFEDENVH